MTRWARVSAFGLLGLVSAGSVEAQQPSNAGAIEIQVRRPRTLPGEQAGAANQPAGSQVIGSNSVTGGQNVAQYEGLKRAISASQLHWASQQAGDQAGQAHYRQLRQQAQLQARLSLQMISGAEQDAQQAVTNPQFVQAAQRYRQILFTLCGIPGGGTERGEGAVEGRVKLSAEDFAKVTLINAAVCQAVESAEWVNNPQIARYYPASTDWDRTLALFLPGQPAAGAVGANDPPANVGGVPTVEQLAQQAQALIVTLRNNAAGGASENGRPIR